MKKQDLLTQKISKHFSLHPSRQKTLASMIFSALCSNNVHHQSLARYVDSPNPKAGLRKVERFFVKSRFPLKNTRKPLSILLGEKESLTSPWIEPTGNMVTRISIILS